MTPPDHHPTSQDQAAGTLDGASREFVLWLFQAIGLRVCAEEAPAAYSLAFPESVAETERAGHPYVDQVGKRFSFQQPPAGDGRGELTTDSQSVERLTWQSPLMQWLLAQLQGGQRVLHATAARQPLSVHELAEHLFAQYRVDGGHMQLAGCRLEDRPFLRLTYLEAGGPAATPHFAHHFGTDEGQLLDAALRQELELDELVPGESRWPRVDSALVKRWVDLIRRQSACSQADEDGSSLVAVTLVWCKYAEGKLAFSIGKHVAELPFSGWGRMFVSRRLLPPPYACPLSGRCSYHLAATDDGRITVAEAIGRCAESGRRVLESELSQCAVTLRRVLPEYLQECPCTGEQVLQSLLQRCRVCQQLVSPAALVGEQCQACRTMLPVPQDDPRLRQILERYPRLGRLRNLRRAETSSVQVVSGNTTWRRLLVVFSKPDGEVLHLAFAGRLSGGWTTVPEAQRPDWLQ